MILNTFNFGGRRPGPVTGGKAWLRLVPRPDALLVLLWHPGLHAGSPGRGMHWTGAGADGITAPRCREASEWGNVCLRSRTQTGAA
jgi:hypothetical protein